LATPDALAGIAVALPAAAAVCSATDTATLTTKLADATCDTINVAAGPYTGPFSVSRSVILQGANVGVSPNPNTGSRGAESAVTSAGDGFVLDANGINVTIAGFSITSSGGAAELVTATAASTTTDIERNILAKGANAVELAPGFASTTVNDNFITGTTSAALQFSGPGGAMAVTSNRVDSTRRDGSNI